MMEQIGFQPESEDQPKILPFPNIFKLCWIAINFQGSCDSRAISVRMELDYTKISANHACLVDCPGLNCRITRALFEQKMINQSRRLHKAILLYFAIKMALFCSCQH
jgi:hypothetical protein